MVMHGTALLLHTDDAPAATTRKRQRLAPTPGSQHGGEHALRHRLPRGRWCTGPVVLGWGAAARTGPQATSALVVGLCGPAKPRSPVFATTLCPCRHLLRAGGPAPLGADGLTGPQTGAADQSDALPGGSDGTAAAAAAVAAAAAAAPMATVTPSKAACVAGFVGGLGGGAGRGLKGFTSLGESGVERVG
jgi:hypothetical protein